MRKVGARARGGFTLIEMLLSIAIIAIIAALSVPFVIGYRNNSYESDAISAVKNVHTAESQYRVKNGQYGTLAELQNAGLINFGARLQGGYTLTIVVEPSGEEWHANADAPAALVLENRSFFIDSTGVIRHNKGGPATSSSPNI